MGGLMNLLNQLKFKRSLGLGGTGLPTEEDDFRLPNQAQSLELPPNDPPLMPVPEIDDTENLYGDPRSLEAYRQHALNTPTRENSQPDKLGRGLAALSGFLQQDQNPNINQTDAMNKLLDRPYEDARKDYTIKREGLQGAVGAEESSLNRKRLGSQRKEDLEYRKEASRLASEDRKAERERRDRESLERNEDRDLDRASRESLTREQIEARKEQARMNADLRRDIASNKAPSSEPLVDIYDPETRQNIKVPRSQAVGKPSRVTEKETNRQQFVEDSITELEEAREFFSKNKGVTGPLQGRISKGKRFLDMNDPKVNKYMNVLESYRGESLPQKAGTALTKTELSVYDPLLAGVNQPDDQLMTNLEETIRRLKNMRGHRNPGSKTKLTIEGYEVEEE